MAEEKSAADIVAAKQKKAHTTEKALEYLMASKGMSRQEAIEKLRKIRAQRNESLEEASSTAAASIHAATRKQSGGKTASPTHGIRVGDNVKAGGKVGKVAFVNGDEVHVKGTNEYFPNRKIVHNVKDVVKEEVEQVDEISHELASKAYNAREIKTISNMHNGKELNKSGKKLSKSASYIHKKWGTEGLTKAKVAGEAEYDKALKKAMGEETQLDEISSRTGMKAFSARRNKLMLTALSGGDSESDKKKLRKIRDNLERKWAKAEKAREMKEETQLDEISPGLALSALKARMKKTDKAQDNYQKTFKRSRDHNIDKEERQKSKSEVPAARKAFSDSEDKEIKTSNHIHRRYGKSVLGKAYEETQIDEISKDALHKYIKAAVFDQSVSSNEKRLTDKKDHKEYAEKRSNKRSAGLNKAFGKLDAKNKTNEEALQEISSDLVKRYKKEAGDHKSWLEKHKASQEDRLKWLQDPMADRKDMTSIDDAKRRIKGASSLLKSRNKGLERANKRVSEDVLNELSPETKASYSKKAKDEVSQLKDYVKTGDGEYKDIAKNMIKRREKGIKRANEEVSPALLRKYRKIIMNLKGNNSFPIDAPEEEEDSTAVERAEDHAKTDPAHKRRMNHIYARGLGVSESLADRYLKKVKGIV